MRNEARFFDEVVSLLLKPERKPWQGPLPKLTARAARKWAEQFRDRYPAVWGSPVTSGAMASIVFDSHSAEPAPMTPAEETAHRKDTERRASAHERVEKFGGRHGRKNPSRPSPGFAFVKRTPE